MICKIVLSADAGIEIVKEVTTEQYLFLLEICNDFDTMKVKYAPTIKVSAFNEEAIKSAPDVDADVETIDKVKFHNVVNNLYRK